MNVSDFDFEALFDEAKEEGVISRFKTCGDYTTEIDHWIVKKSTLVTNLKYNIGWRIQGNDVQWIEIVFNKKETRVYEKRRGYSDITYIEGPWFDEIAKYLAWLQKSIEHKKIKDASIWEKRQEEERAKEKAELSERISAIRKCFDKNMGG